MRTITERLTTIEQIEARNKARRNAYIERCVISVNVLPEEKAQLQRLAESDGRSLSGYIRSRLLADMRRAK